MEPWLRESLKYIGEKEIPGPRHNPLIVEMGQESGIDWWNNDEDAWCAVFVNGCLVRAGYSSTRSALARSFLDYGIPISEPVPGAIVVFPRGNNELYGHVGIVERVNKNGTITIVNGNVSNQVKRSVYRIDAILPGGIRWPSEERKEYELGNRLLSRGSRGPDVVEMQTLLNVVGARIAVDGIFGTETEKAVKDFQREKNISIDGIVGPATISALLTFAGEAVEKGEKAESAATGAAVGAGGIATAGAAIEVAKQAQELNDGTLFGLGLAILALVGLAFAGYWVFWRKARSNRVGDDS